MLDMNFVRNNPDIVKENIRKKFQDQKLVLVDEVIELDKQYRAAIQKADGLRNQRKTISKQIGGLMAKGQRDEAEALKAKVNAMADELVATEKLEEELQAEVRKRMLVIPNIIDDSVPVGKDDTESSSMTPCLWARTTARTLRWSALASLWCRTLRYPTMWTSWSASAASTWTAPARPAATASIT